jgi:hypothetical protein
MELTFIYIAAKRAVLEKLGTSSLFVIVLLLSECSSDLLSFSKEVSLVISPKRKAAHCHVIE